MQHQPSRAFEPLSSVIALVVAAALVAGGCQAAATVRPSAASTASTALPSSTVSSPGSPLPTAAATAIPALEVSGSRAELDAGRYTRRGFEPRITFDLDGPWHSVNALSGFFDVQQDVGSPDVIAVQFARPQQIYAAPDRPANVVNAKAAVDMLKANARLVTVESSGSKIGGLDGFQVTVENSTGMVGDAQVMEVSPGALSISPGRRLWIAFFDTPNGLLAIMVGGSVAKWDEALAAAEPVLESVTIGR